MACTKCSSDQILEVCGKTSNRCCVSFNTKNSDGFSGHHTYDGYVPANLGIGRGDYIEFSCCLNCGQIQGEFPISKDHLEAPTKEYNRR